MGGNNWGVCGGGGAGPGCGPQEEFRACADIAIGRAHHKLTNKQPEAARGGREPWMAAASTASKVAWTVQPAGIGSTPKDTGTRWILEDRKGGSFSYFWRALLGNKTEGRRVERVGGSGGGHQVSQHSVLLLFLLLSLF